MSVTSALDRIHRWAETHDPEFIALLKPGLSRQRIDDLTAGLPFTLAEEVYELYQWRNGQNEGEFKVRLCQQNFDQFMPLQEALAEYAQFQADNFNLEVDEGFCDFPESGGWLPLFGEGRDFTATLGQPAGALTSPLVCVWREDKTELRFTLR